MDGAATDVLNVNDSQEMEFCLIFNIWLSNRLYAVTDFIQSWFPVNN